MFQNLKEELLQTASYATVNKWVQKVICDWNFLSKSLRGVDNAIRQNKDVEGHIELLDLDDTWKKFLKYNWQLKLGIPDEKIVRLLNIEAQELAVFQEYSTLFRD